MTEKRLTLPAKLAAITADMEWVPKNGNNTFHKYKFATESDVSEHARKALASHNVFLSLGMELGTYTREYEGGEAGRKLTMRTSFVGKLTIYDGDLVDWHDPAKQIVTYFPAYSHDTDDKGVNKAVTAFVKYALLKTFIMSSGDDPDGHAEGRGPEQAAPAGIGSKYPDHDRNIPPDLAPSLVPTGKEFNNLVVTIRGASPGQGDEHLKRAIQTFFKRKEFSQDDLNLKWSDLFTYDDLALYIKATANVAKAASTIFGSEIQAAKERASS